MLSSAGDGRVEDNRGQSRSLREGWGWTGVAQIARLCCPMPQFSRLQTGANPSPGGVGGAFPVPFRQEKS